MPGDPDKQQPQSATTGAQPDPYYGQRYWAKISANFVSHLFGCPREIVPVPGQTGPPQLDHFIAYALHRTRLPKSVTHAALFYLQRLKARYPSATGSSGHRLFIAAFMIASKIICDDTYSNKSWCIVAQGMFAIRELNQMEREMCGYLEWNLNVKNSLLEDFETLVSSNFLRSGRYPNIQLSEGAAGTSATSGFSQSVSARIFAPTAPADVPVWNNNDVPMSSYPPTPGASSSASASPASTAGPRTPTDGFPGCHVPRTGMGSEAPRLARPRAIALPEQERLVTAPIDPYRDHEEQGDHANAILGELGSEKRVLSPTMRTKLQVGRDMYAYATRTIW